MSASISTISPSNPRTATENARPSAISRSPADAVISGRAPAPDPHADHIDAHRRPVPVLAGQPQPGQPAQPADLARGDRVRQAPVTVAGTRLDLDEHHRAGGLVGRRSHRVRRSGSASCGAGSATPSWSGDPRRAPRPSLPAGSGSLSFGPGGLRCRHAGQRATVAPT